jgi:hypothetical protein
MWENGGMALHTLKQMEVSGRLHASAALSPGEQPPIAIEQEAGWAQGRYERFGEMKSLAHTGDRTIIPQTFSPEHNHYTN